MEREGSKARRLTHYEGTALGARYAPNGQRIVFQQGFQPPEFSKLLVMNANGSDVEHLTRGRFSSAGARKLSRDGRELAFNSAESIYLMGGDGTKPRKPTGNGPHPASR